MFASVFVIALGLCYCSRASKPVKGAEIEVRSGSVDLFEGNMLELRCKLKAGNHVSYKWLLNGRLVSQSLLHDDRLLINRTTSQDSGSYRCVASNSFNQTDFFTSNSTEVVITVREPVKGAEIEVRSGSVDLFEGNMLELRCKLKAGNHVSYKWLLNGQLVSQSLLHDDRLLINRTTSQDSGSYRCVASNSFNQTDFFTSNSTEVVITVREPVKGAEIEVRSGSVDLFEGNMLELRCKLKAGNHVSYKWLLNGQLVSQSLLHDDRLLINRTTSQDSGSYRCVASNSFNQTDFFTSNSTEVVITVRDLVSTPNISFTVLKEDFQNYSAVVTCRSTRGTPPVTFSLYNSTEVIASVTVEEQFATFKVPLILGQDLGFLQCQARNGDNATYSEKIPLEVVPVGGPVKMPYTYDSGENYDVIGVTFYCKAEKGTHPRYQWFLNGTLLDDRGSFYYVDHQPPEMAMLMLSVGDSSAGTYHCEVSDSFDNTTAISSRRLYLDKHTLNRLPVWVVAVVFGSFTFLILLVSVCCGLGVVFRRRHYGEKSLLDFEMERMTPVYYGKLDLSHYNEDTDVVNAARWGEVDQASLDSVDEWPQIEEEKKTLEDEPAEEP
ncbi:muscle M-line assembly protein unc-89-like isoform X4 [Acanthopagrus latus]|uniref:muscle M-line assembly protein unc-89-like isoform X4 n=1 Tax=Acanthopagrus latus TaxID=8177 RepID=UPI00187C62F3|nr:muscle M-line assembly protein unc-89-like isoform X4 [Acanthopagrus latus]